MVDPERAGVAHIGGDDVEPGLQAALGHSLPGIESGFLRLAEQEATGYRARLLTLAEG